MLESLTSVAWDAIPTAYEKGVQLPKLIKKLSSRSESVRDKAFFDLREEIAHQGQVEPDAALAVAPFLIELIQAPKAQDRDRLLWLLGDLASGGSSINWIATPVVRPFEALAKTCVDSHGELWAKLLADSDEKVVAATTLVVAFATDPERWRAPLVALGASPSALGRASALLALEILSRRSVAVPVSVFRSALANSDPLTRSAALIGLARLEPSTLDAADYDLAISLARAPAVEHLPWADGLLDYWLTVAIAEAASAQGKSEVLWKLIDARAGALPGPGELATPLANRVLKPYSGPRLRTSEELDEDARTLLGELCVRSLVGKDIETLAWHAGLFDSAADLARLLGLSNSGPLDRVIGNEPLWRLFNDQLNNRIGFDALAAAVDTACAQGDAFDLLYDAATGYRIALQWPIVDQPLSPERFALVTDTIARLLARCTAPDAWAAEIRVLRPAPGKYNTTLPRRPEAGWLKALLLALARSSLGSLLESDAAVHEQFKATADNSSKHSVAVACLLLAEIAPDQRWRLMSRIPFYQSWSSTNQNVFYRGAWDLLDLAPPEPGSDWVLDALEKCEPETIPVDRLALAEATFGAVWQEKVAARKAGFAPHQLEALERARQLNQRAIG